MSGLKYITRTFDELSNEELYRVLQLRQEVFVVEQDCPYLDADGVDLQSYHVLGLNEEGRICAYTRIVPKGLSYDSYVSIGRVVNGPEVRGTGEGKKLMAYSIDTCKELYPKASIKISAQNYLLSFYESFGFDVHGDSYLEDGIPHTAMVLETV